MAAPLRNHNLSVQAICELRFGNGSLCEAMTIVADSFWTWSGLDSFWFVAAARTAVTKSPSRFVSGGQILGWLIGGGQFRFAAVLV